MTGTENTDLRPSEQFRHLYTPPAIQGDFTGKHIITAEQFDKQDLQSVIDAAGRLRERVANRDTDLVRLCAGQLMASMFFEASTRTDLSFQAAMRRLGGSVVSSSNGVQFSSVYKGENLADTVRAAGCYADLIVIRHPSVGSSYEAAYYIDRLNERIRVKCAVVSGGDGIGEHPTQALLDLFTIVDQKKGADNLKITLVGDLLYGRTVHSLAKLIGLYQTSGTKLCFVSPASLRIPDTILDFLDAKGVPYYETTDLYEVLGETDVIYWTRIQEERFVRRADYEAVRDNFIMTPGVLNQAKRDVILMHPLPRKNEMGTSADHDILDTNPRAVYFQQMENGMFVRMAILAKVLGVSDSNL
ncbi:MAG TPA: aspartate carbamoyltransferase [Phototrophicaceae bacterium]|jgi:aspartate carbamoyltransferase|nr:aspartate carbamoyltransferase [Phototrophicaceae bacterium]